VCDPAEEAGTVKLLFQAPVALADIPEATVFPSKVTVIPVSLALNPEPVTVTELPCVPLVLLKEIAAVVVNVAETTPVTDPDTVIVWEPEAEAGTIKLLLQAPTEVAVPVATELPSKATVILSYAPKPAPVIVIELPGEPEVLLQERAAVVVNVAEAGVVVTSPDAVTVWGPEAEAGTIKLLLKAPAEVAVAVTTVLLSKAIVILSDAPKPVPVTATVVPGELLAGLREMVAAAKTVAELNVSNTSTTIIIDTKVARSLIATLALFITTGLLLNYGPIVCNQSFKYYTTIL
jgi:hypothetical protein